MQRWTRVLVTTVIVMAVLTILVALAHGRSADAGPDLNPHGLLGPLSP